MSLEFYALRCESMMTTSYILRLMFIDLLLVRDGFLLRLVSCVLSSLTGQKRVYLASYVLDVLSCFVSLVFYALHCESVTSMSYVVRRTFLGLLTHQRRVNLTPCVVRSLTCQKQVHLASYVLCLTCFVLRCES